MRSGTIVGSFKIDLKTVYDAAGRVYHSFYSRISFFSLSVCGVQMYFKILKKHILVRSFTVYTFYILCVLLDSCWQLKLAKIFD